MSAARLTAICRAAFNMRVLAYDPFLTAEQIKARGAEKVELDELLAQSDYVSVHCPLTKTQPQNDGRGAVRPHEAGGVFHHHRARLHP